MERRGAIINKICRHMNRWVPASVEYERNSPRYWRKRFFTIFMFCTLIACALFFVPVLGLAFKQNLWGLVGLDLAAYACAWSLLPLSCRLRFEVVAVFSVLLAYTLGGAITAMLGPLSGGPIWLFAAAVLAGALLGVDAAIGALALNALMLAAIGWFISQGWYGHSHPFLVSPERGVAAALSFVFLNGVTAVSVAALMDYVEEAYHREKEATSLLRRERGHLNLTREMLKNEIAARHSIQTEFMTADERLRALLNSIPEAVCFKDVKFHNLIVNKAFEILFNRNTSEIVGKGDEEFMVPEFARRRVESDRMTLYSGMTSRFIEHHTDLDGRVRLLDTTKTAFTDPLGRSAGIIGVSRVMAGRLPEEQKLLISIEHYLELVERLCDGAIVLRDNPSQITYATPRIDRIIGFEAGELMSFNAERIHELIHPKDRSSFFQRLETGGAEQRSWAPFEVRFFHKNDSIVWMKVFFSRICHCGRASTIIGFSDVTETRKTETRLQQEQKLEIVGKLASGIAHDFNNVLGVIIGYSELMDMFDLRENDHLRSNLQEILAAAYRGKDLVRQILNFSRPTEHEKKPLLVSPLIKETVKFLRASFPATIEIRPKIETEKGTVLADTTQLFQVLMNLCVNAAQAMSGGPGVLEIGLCEEKLVSREKLVKWDLPQGDYLKLTVSDTGTGIGPEVASHIFEPYFTTKKLGQGSGLGLSVVNAIVRNHGGAIIVDNHVGRGTVFKVCLPRIPYESSINQQEESHKAYRGDERVLFVDDEAPLAEFAQDALSSLGYDVVAVTSSEEALRLFCEDPDNFDVVIADITMPRQTGITLASKIQQIRPDTPIVLCSGYKNGMAWEQIKDLGVREFISKPFGVTALSKAVRKALARKS